MRIKDKNICKPSHHRRVLEFFLIQTGYSRPLIIGGEFWSSFLYRHNYFAADHRRVLEFFLIQTGLPRR